MIVQMHQMGLRGRLCVSQSHGPALASELSEMWKSAATSKKQGITFLLDGE